jgi:hypothetical protein
VRHEVKACSRCGSSPDGADDELPAGWSLETNARGVQWLCLACTREHVRAIEAKLPEEWW